MIDFPLSPKAKRNENGYLDVCPAHHDRNPSLSIKVTADGKLLLHCFAGCRFEDIIHAAGLSGDRIKSNNLAPQLVADPQTSADRIQKAKSLWNKTIPIEGTTAETYLRSRSLSIWSEDMRFHPNLYFADDQTERPALVCAVRRDGKFVGVHRTFLNLDGKKLGKKMLGPCGGGSVNVGGSGDITVVAEGIENALSVRIMSGDHRARYYAALSAGGMRNLKLAPTSGDLMIFADGDKTGMTAAYELGERASLQGWNASTMLPPKDRDWNDELITGLSGLM